MGASPDWGGSESAGCNPGLDEDSLKDMLEDNLKTRKIYASRRPNPARSDPCTIEAECQFNQSRIELCTMLYRQIRELPFDGDMKTLIEMQWKDIFARTLDAALGQLEGGEELQIGAANNPDINVRDQANMTVSAIIRLRAQSDLSIPEIPDWREFYGSGKFLKSFPFSTVHSIDYFETEVHLFSDSVLKLGKTVNKWPQQYADHLSEAGATLKTLHCRTRKWILGRAARSYNHTDHK